MKQELNIDWNDINKVADRVPHLAKIMPASDYHIEDVHNAGGVSAIINELLKKPGAIHGDRMTVTGKTMRENVKDHEILNQECYSYQKTIHILSKVVYLYYSETFAPEGSIIKVGAVDTSIGGYHRGPAICL